MVLSGSQRLKVVVLFFVLVGLIGNLVWQFSRSNMILNYYLLSELMEKAENFQGKFIQVAGLVEEGSLQQLPDLKKIFILTDEEGLRLKVYHKGPVPDLFREGQGIVGEGVLFSDKEGEGFYFQSEKLIASHANVYDTTQEKHDLQKKYIKESLLKQKDQAK